MSNPLPSKLPVATKSFKIEQLEERKLLSGAYSLDTTPAFVATSSDLHDVKAGPFTKGGANLANLYISYHKWKKAGATGTFTPNPDMFIRQGDSVELSVRTQSNIEDLITQLRPLGIQVENRDAKDQLVTLFAPISQLHSLVANTNATTVLGLVKPEANQEGSVDNQANQAEQADKARAIFGVDGTGVKVGVLSDSVNSAGGGLADSQSTGDLGHIHVVQDSFGEDEGRAMLELIHDMAPGAELYFATANNNVQDMADNIIKLADQGCKVIVDDYGYPNESFFQEGVVAEAIGTVRARGVVYLSAAGNGGLGGIQEDIHWDDQPDGTSYVDFRAGNGVDSAMDLTVDTGGFFTMQWDNPWNGVVGHVTANLDVTFYDKATGKIVAQGNDDNFFTGAPMEQFFLPSGDLQMRIQLTGLADGAARPTVFKISSGHSAIGDTEYPMMRSTSFGHNASRYTISVGAVPSYGAAPFVDDLAQTASELFSSGGPVTYYFYGDGTRRPKPITLEKPDLSGLDDVNTSFFTLSDSSKDTDANPNFAGTSAAAPDVAAVAALLLSFKPNLTVDQVTASLISSAKIHPLNNAKHNTWDPQGGWGLVDAVRALEVQNDAPYVNISRVVPDPRSAPVDSVSFTFSREVGGFNLAHLNLKRDGQRGPDLLHDANGDPIAGVSLTTSDNVTWVLNGLSNLTTVNGDYQLTLKPGGTDGTTIRDLGGHALMSDEREEWHIVHAAPAAPTRLTATALSRSSIQLQWVDNSDNETRFKLERGTNPDFTAGLKVINVPANATSVVDGNLNPNTHYYYRLRAFSPNGYSAATRADAFSLSNGDIVVDNNSATKVGSWSTSTSGTGIFGADFLTDGNTAKGKKSVTFTPDLPVTGKYFVYARWPSGSHRATNVPIDVNSADGLTTVVKDQQNTGKNGAWVLLGTFSFNKGTGGSVTIRNAGTNGTVVADAIRFLSSAPVTDKQAEALSFSPAAATAMSNIFAAKRIDAGDPDLLSLI